MWLLLGFAAGVVMTAICLITGAFVLTTLATAFRIDKTVSSIVIAIIYLGVFAVILMSTWQELSGHGPLAPGFIAGVIATLLFTFRRKQK